MTNWTVYILVCADGTYYTGIARDVARRLARHQAGRGAKYTKTRLPVRLLATSGPMSQGDALRLERRIKKLPRAKKLATLASY